MRRSAARRLGQLCLVALLLVPVLLGAHHHADPAGSRDCATCVVVHHGPVAAVPVLTIDAPHGSVPIVPIRIEPGVSFVWVQQLGRAPPKALLSPTV